MLHHRARFCRGNAEIDEKSKTQEKKTERTTLKTWDKTARNAVKELGRKVAQINEFIINPMKRKLDK